MTPADARAVMHTYLTEVAQKGRLELIEELAHPDVVDDANVAFGGPTGVAGFVAHAKGFARNVTDPEITIHRIIGDEQSVMGQWSFRGTHTGPWLGRAPTGETIEGTVFSFFDLIDGRISRYSLWLHTTVDGGVVFDSDRPGSVVDGRLV